jgi:tetratricopeptide (TPR) repeat protein
MTERSTTSTRRSDSIRKYVNAHVGRSVTYVGKGDYDYAISNYNQAIQLNPKLALAYTNRSDAHLHKGDHDRAIVDASEAIRLDQKNADAYSNRGEAYSRKGNYDQAIADFDQALKLDPPLDDARRARERMQLLLAKRSAPGVQTNAPAR